MDAFLIGSEMRSLTQIRGVGNSFPPAVAQLVQLAADVRTILGSEVKIGYAADWSEYFGYHPQDGSGDIFYHLDPLWADDNIDFIGIDNYMPLSDWRDEEGEADEAYGSIYNLDYLKANIQGGGRAMTGSTTPMPPQKSNCARRSPMAHMTSPGSGG